MNKELAIVTGVPGWLGSRLVECLTQGLANVEQLANPSGRKINILVNDALSDSQVGSWRDHSQVRVVRGNLNNSDSLSPLFEGAAGASVFHLAGVIHPTHGVGEFYEVNTNGTKTLLALAQKAEVRRFVYMSSNSPMGTNKEKDEQFDESSPYVPYMNYGKSKMLAEQAVIEAGLSKSIETVIIRAPWFYGPGQPERQNLFFSMIKNGKVPLVGSGLNKRSMAYIDNLCQGLLLADKIEKACGQIYWIADRRPYSMKEIIDTIEKILEKDFHMTVAHKRMRLPGVASEMAYQLDGLLQNFGVYHQKIHVLSEMNKTIACSIAKAERELGFDPKVDLESGMRASIQWVLDNGGTI